MPIDRIRHVLAPSSIGRARALLVLGALIAGGCADRFTYTPLNSPPRPLSPRPIAAVEVFAVTPPARAHTDVGLIQVVGPKPPPPTAPVHTNDGLTMTMTEEAPATDEENVHEMIASLRQRAAEIGCDAIVITSIDRPRRRRDASVQASCVVYNNADRVDAD